MKREKVLIEVDELLARIDDPNLRIFDTTMLFFRKEDDPTAFEEYEARHIPGAAFFEHLNFSDSDAKYMYTMLPPNELAAQIGQVGISADSEVVFYSTNMMPSASRAWWVLHHAGHSNMRILNGGLPAWQAAGGAVVKGVDSYEPAEFTGQPRPKVLAGKEEVLAAMEDGDVCTVNTLTAEIYDKEHITGSSLLSCMSLLSEDMTTLLPDDVLSAKLQVEMPYKRVITYCGGGIAATLNAVAHLIAGNENVAVYDGSMSEWTGEGLPTVKAAPA